MRGTGIEYLSTNVNLVDIGPAADPHPEQALCIFLRSDFHANARVP